MTFHFLYCDVLRLFLSAQLVFDLKMLEILSHCMRWFSSQTGHRVREDGIKDSCVPPAVVRENPSRLRKNGWETIDCVYVCMHISEPPYDGNFTPQMLGSIKRMIKHIAGCSLKYRFDNNIPTAELQAIST